MRKFTDFELTTLKKFNRTFHGKATDYAYRFTYHHMSKWRYSTAIQGDITGAGKNALKIVLTANVCKITGKRLGKREERVIFSRIVKYWDFHPKMKGVENREWKYTHSTLCETLMSLDSMLYSLCYGLGELNSCVTNSLNTD